MTVLRPLSSVVDDPFRGVDPLDWPSPSRVRTASGAPGPEYWQQRADYTIAASLDTADKVVRGTVSIRYTNNSPDTLRFVWLQLDQNLYKPGSKGSFVFPAQSRFGVRGFPGGYDITGLQVNGRGTAGKIDDTMMRIDLDAPLLPKGGQLTIGMQYSFAVPEHGSDRMGRDSSLYLVAQWYPRMAVYDDARGWNTDPYLGQGEFYLDYGDIDYTVTVPAGFVVTGSGTLQNQREVLTTAQAQRLERAARSTSVVQVVTTEEAAAKRARPVTGTKTWKFRAERVRDVAWAAAPDFRWDATSWDGVLIQALYQSPKAGQAWESAAEQTQWAIRTYSDLWMRYPYPQATSVAGPVSGMEYPMLVMVGYGTADPSSIFSTIDHEQGHEWFPMVVGSNERRHAWMDEGFNTFQNAFSNERRNPGTVAFPAYLGSWRQIVESGRQSPVVTPADRIDPDALGAMAYRKPGAVLLALRAAVIGRDVMDRAMREYVRRWAFKHPTPADFFRTVENVSGQDLGWFWRAFFYGTDVLDIAVDGVTMRQAGGENVVEVHLRRATTIPFPVTMRLKLDDRSTTDIRLPVEIWTRTDRYVATLPVKRAVVGVRLWPDPSVPDVNSANDVWGDAPLADTPAGSAAGGTAPSVRPPGRQNP
ncbi:MAG TPA: M1 family metallopeptidase [Gemmatimonadaceae bacterium]|nr:M1 family metallopeptidase [Gemmatimonadaceae bacterium]